MKKLVIYQAIITVLVLAAFYITYIIIDDPAAEAVGAAVVVAFAATVVVAFAATAAVAAAVAFAFAFAVAVAAAVAFADDKGAKKKAIYFSCAAQFVIIFTPMLITILH